MLTIPNILTLTRIPLLFVILALLFSDGRWAMSLAVLMFGLGALTDWLDGYLARKLDQVSTFGKLMDALIDKVFVIGMFVGLLVSPFPELPKYCVVGVILIITREFMITGLRLVAATRGLVLASEKVGKYKTASQMGAIVLLMMSEALFRDIGLPVDWAGAVYWTGFAFFWVAVVLTAASGIIYMFKYASVFNDPDPE
ncbi:MAG: CDP-diacylglycerol--glycerol-3-phosphate 3-phosphatidyltransferase [Opitutales bacterium]|nr:CDP-diacylglycerol--glycerol-3-phosphate 3-phosphatidyltransferase [Opitutales bacterium]